MKYNYNQLQHITRQVLENAPPHSEMIHIVYSTVEGHEQGFLSDVDASRQWLIRKKKSDDDLIFYVGISNTEARGTITKTTKHRKHQVGRPPNIVKGKKVDLHTHILIGFKVPRTTKEVRQIADDLLLFFKKRRNKYHNSKMPKSSTTSMGAVKYITRQSEHIYTDNSYEWEYFLDPWYDDTPQETE